MNLENSPVNEHGLEPKRKTAERLGVCTKTLDRWAATGRLRGRVKINDRDYFPRGVMPKVDD
jgi:predicted site-specific integrase-resolvase